MAAPPQPPWSQALLPLQSPLPPRGEQAPYILSHASAVLSSCRLFFPITSFPRACELRECRVLIDRVGHELSYLEPCERMNEQTNERRCVLTHHGSSALQACAPESAQPLPAAPCPRDWPSRGEITFRDYRMRYRDGTPLVLDGLSLHIQSGQTVGIVGRTGSGEDRLRRCFRVVSARPLGPPVTQHLRRRPPSAASRAADRPCFPLKSLL